MSTYVVRSIDDIFKELLLEKQTFSTLDGLLPDNIIDEATLITTMTNGKAPEWVLWLYNIAVQIHLTELSANSSIVDITDIFSDSIVATKQWYVDKALEFQYGDVVIIDPITYQVGYATIDETKQVIGSCTIREFGGAVVLQLRGKNTDLLTEDELNSFVVYMNKVKIAGTKINVENVLGDLISSYMTIIYDGTYNLSDIKTLIETNIEEYYNNIELTGKFISNALVDKLQQLDGIIDPQYNYGIAINTLGLEVEFTHEYETNAGWARINEPLVDTITYIGR